MTGMVNIIVETHEEDQSLYNVDMRWDRLMMVTPGKHFDRFMMTTVNEMLNTGKNQCDEKNEHSLSRCADKYFESKLGCKLPWAAPDNSSIA